MTTEPFQARVPRDLVIVDGVDATSFLQSLVSQDLDPIPVGASARALLLQPQGKLIVDFYAYRAEPDTWWCVCEGGFGAALAEGLRRFKIRVKVDVREEPVAALAIRGTAFPATVDGVGVIAVAWNGGDAFDAVGPDVAITALSMQLALPALDADGYERARVEAGVPRMGVDMDDRTIPQEALLERDAVSFTKGCFVGQELVCRIDTRGHVNRLLRRLRATASVAPGAEITSDGKTVGAVTSAADTVALALVRREVEPGATVAIAGTPATVEAL
jgi:hypothetical protein